MVTIRSVNEIISNLMDYYRLAQPDLDIKYGTVARDLFIDGPASQLSLLYDELSGTANKQSLRLVIGSDLDKLAKNFGVVRKQSTASSGVGLLTFNTVTAPINVNKGSTITANNGFAFSVVNGIAISPAAANFYRSVASKFRDQLSFVGITDEFAVEVTLAASSAGSSGNIGTYSLSRANIPGISNVTNINPFLGGTDQETDASFRNRVLSSFSGSSVGTALGYLNVALGVSGVSDAYVVEPGDPLMTRDGTIVTTATDGTRTIVSEGSGGKVDVIVLGSSLIQNTDSFIYRDKSNNNDPSNTKNDIVLGQIAADVNKTVNKRRIDNIKDGTLPKQPVDAILQVTGSLSGSNFIPESVDQYGRVTGNYKLVKDEGVYQGCPWGSDKFAWINNQISLFQEDKVKGQVSGQDSVSFTDVLKIPQIQQSISITNENSTINFDRSIIKLLHTPATNVTRVFNVNTGERYIITNQNLDSTGTYNTSGRIKISGNTLPSPSDILQVDYSWIVDYDQYSDFDGLLNTDNIRTVTDSIDWGLASIVKNERIVFTNTTSSNFFTGISSHPINTIVSAKKFNEVNGSVQQILSGVFVNRFAVIINNLADATSTVDSITFKNTNIELYNTSQNNGSFTNANTIVGIQILHNTTIILPTDTTAVLGDKVSVVMNSSDVYATSTTSGNSNGTQITIPAALVNTTATAITLDVNYIADVSTLYASATTSLPASRIGNGFSFSNNGFNNFSIVNTSRRENQIVQKDLSNNLYLELNLPSTDYSLLSNQVMSVIRLSDSLELWNSNNPGTVTVGNSGNYQLILTGYNTPLVGDRTLILYYATDTARFQPFSFSNTTVKNSIETLSTDPATGKLFVSMNDFTTQSSGVNFTVVDPNTDIVLFSGTDGYLVSNNNGTAAFSSLTVNFATQADILLKEVIIKNATDPNNNGTYDIASYVSGSNTLTITNTISKITKDQISVVRVLDGKEVWNYAGVIDASNNKLLLPANALAADGDSVYVMFFSYSNLRQAPTRVIATIVDQVVNTGVITVAGTTITKAENIIFTATNTGLKLNISEAVRKALALNSTIALPSNIKLARISKLEKVSTVGSNNDEVIEVLTTYDLQNITVQNNLFYSDELLSDPSLGNLDFVLSSTDNNTANTQSKNLPTLGDKIRITFYYTTDNDSENLSYTRNGALYSNKKFALINKIFISSGFNTSQSAKLTVTSFTQPSLGSRYKVFYDYLAPKQNERIVVQYNYNKIISDVTFSLENSRPINADVLARGAKLVLLDLTMNVVIADTFINTTTTVLQNLRNQLIAAMATTQLGDIVDVVTLINIAQSVQGIARARVLYFNKTGSIGQVLKVQAQNDEFFASNLITINTETR